MRTIARNVPAHARCGAAKLACRVSFATTMMMWLFAGGPAPAFAAATFIPELRFGVCEQGAPCEWSCEDPFFGEFRPMLCQDGPKLGEECVNFAECEGFPCGGGDAGGSALRCSAGSCTIPPLQETFAGALAVTIDEGACPEGWSGAVVTMGLHVRRADGVEFDIAGRRIDLCNVDIGCSPECDEQYPGFCTSFDCNPGSCPPIVSQLCDASASQLLDEDTCGLQPPSASFLTEASVDQFEFWMKGAKQPLLELLIAGLTAVDGPFPGPHGTVLISDADCEVSDTDPPQALCCVEAGFLADDRTLGVPPGIFNLFESEPDNVAVDVSASLTCPRATLCGNSVDDVAEQCDDGNTADGDGCSAGCITEPASTTTTTSTTSTTSPTPSTTSTTTTSTSSTTTTTTTTTSTTVTTTSTTTTVPARICGDYSGDGEITAADALGVLKTAVGTAECPVSICDVDGNGKVLTLDALRVLKRAVGQDVVFDCPE